jgi:hypothetical protein
MPFSKTQGHAMRTPLFFLKHFGNVSEPHLQSALQIAHVDSHHVL